MSYEVIHTVEERELIETPEGLVSVPKQKPYIILLEGFSLKYVPDEGDRNLSGWEIVPVNSDLIRETFGVTDEDLAPRTMEKPISFGGDKLLRIPKVFTIVSYQSVCRMAPKWKFWMKSSISERGKLPVLHIETDEYPLIMDAVGQIKIVPVCDVAWYEKEE
jgi:hypothetical protein